MRKTHKLQEHRTPPKQSKRMILLSVPPPSRPPCSSALDYDCALDTLSRPPTPIPPIPNISQRYPAPPFPTAGTVQLVRSATCQRTRSSVADPATCLRRRPPVKAEVGRETTRHYLQAQVLRRERAFITLLTSIAYIGPIVACVTRSHISNRRPS